MCTGLKPGVKELAEPLLIARRRLEMSGRTPPVGHEGIVGHVLTEFRQGLPAVALPVFDLIANLSQRLAFPGHLRWRQVPTRMAWHIAEIFGVVTGDAHHPGRPHPARAPHHQRLMQRAILTLERTFGAGMAVDATRVLDDLADFGEQRPARCVSSAMSAKADSGCRVADGDDDPGVVWV